MIHMIPDELFHHALSRESPIDAPLCTVAPRELKFWKCSHNGNTKKRRKLNFEFFCYFWRNWAKIVKKMGFRTIAWFFNCFIKQWRLLIISRKLLGVIKNVAKFFEPLGILQKIILLDHPLLLLFIEAMLI